MTLTEDRVTLNWSLPSGGFWVGLIWPIVVMFVAAVRLDGPLRVFLLVLVGINVCLLAALPLALRRENSKGPVMVLDPAGVTVQNHPTVSWDAFERVEVRWAAPSRPFARMMFTRRFSPVVAFIPRLGVKLPELPRAARRIRRYGTSLVLAPRLTTVTLDQVVEAARTWGGLEVEGLE